MTKLKYGSYNLQSLKSLSLNDSFGPLLSTYDPLDLINGCNAFLSSIGALDRVVTPTRMKPLGIGGHSLI